jgi:hypothetical protein
MKIYVEIELDEIITVKTLNMPRELIHTTEVYQYIRNYFTGLNYKVGNHLRIY